MQAKLSAHSAKRQHMPAHQNVSLEKTANNRRKKSNAGTLTHNKDIKTHYRDSEMDNNDRKRSSYKKLAIT